MVALHESGDLGQFVTPWVMKADAVGVGTILL